MVDHNDVARILIVDDVAENCRLLTQLLQQEGYRTAVAMDGLDALEAVRSVQPDLILSDVTLPGLNGFQLLQRIRSTESFGFIPFILITARNDSHDKIRALDAGADDFLVKPIQRLELIARVRSLIRLKRSTDALSHAARENERLLHEAQQRAFELEALNETARSITAQISLDEVLRSIIERACALVGATSGSIYLTDEHSQTLTVKTLHGISPSYVGRCINYGEGIAGLVAVTGNPMRINNYYEWSGKAPVYADDSSITAVLGVPLVSASRVVGVLDVMADFQVRVFSDEDVRLLNLLAPQAAIAITNALLYDTVAQERDRVQAILDSAYDGFLMLDANQQVAVANTRFSQLTGLDMADLIGRSIGDVGYLLSEVVESTPALNTDTLTRLLRDVERSPHRLVRRTFEMVEPQRAFVEWAGLPVLDRDNRTLGWLNVLHDITQQKDLEHLRDDFISMLVHDLRSPLTAILGGIEMATELGEEMDTVDAEQQREFLVSATRNCHSLLGMINSLLEVSRLEAGKLPLTATKINVADLILNSTEQVTMIAKDKHLEIVPKLPHIPVEVEVDVDKMQRVLVNLLGNAIKFSPEGLDVRISVSIEDIVRRRGMTSTLRDGTGGLLGRPSTTNMLSLRDFGTTGMLGRSVPSAVPPRRALLITVADEGQGIPPSDLDRIFDKFVQLPNSHNKGGSGLGLAFCKLVIEAHGGRIWAESAPGRGSKFYLSLPIVVDADPAEGVTA